MGLLPALDVIMQAYNASMMLPSNQETSIHEGIKNIEKVLKDYSFIHLFSKRKKTHIYHFPYSS